MNGSVAPATFPAVASAPATPPAWLLFRSSVAVTPSTPPTGWDSVALELEIELAPVLAPTLAPVVADPAATVVVLVVPLTLVTVCTTELDVLLSVAECDDFVADVTEPQPPPEYLLTAWTSTPCLCLQSTTL